jgi:hypothetical protein
MYLCVWGRVDGTTIHFFLIHEKNKANESNRINYGRNKMECSFSWHT